MFVIIHTDDNKSTNPERKSMKPYSTNALLHVFITHTAVTTCDL